MFVYLFIYLYTQNCAKTQVSWDCQWQWFKQPYSNRQSTHTHTPTPTLTHTPSIITYKVIEIKKYSLFLETSINCSI